MASKARKKTSKKTPNKEIADDVKEIVNTFDELYYKKPAGFFAYIATCASKMLSGPFDIQESKKKKGE